MSKTSKIIVARWLGRFEPPIRPVRMRQCVRMAGSNLRFTPFQETGRSRLLLGVPDCYWAFSAMDWAFPIPIGRSRLWIGRSRKSGTDARKCRCNLPPSGDNLHLHFFPIDWASMIGKVGAMCRPPAAHCTSIFFPMDWASMIGRRFGSQDPPVRTCFSSVRFQKSPESAGSNHGSNWCHRFAGSGHDVPMEKLEIG